MPKKKKKSLKKNKHFYDHKIQFNVTYHFTTDKPWTSLKRSLVVDELHDAMDERLKKYKPSVMYKSYDSSVNQPRTEYQ